MYRDIDPAVPVGIVAFIIGVVVGVILAVHEAAVWVEKAEVCRRAIIYQLDKKPEEVDTILKTERQREGR
jgi:hypothetical protein